MQSPINIENDSNSTAAANYSDFAFSVGYKTEMTGSISNTGYASMSYNNSWVKGCVNSLTQLFHSLSCLISEQYNFASHFPNTNRS